MPKFKLVSKFSPTGDQPQAIEKIAKNLKSGIKNQILLGVTGSGKTFDICNVIAKIQKPTLIISHNKTLCAQLYQEFKDFFPENSVHYFVSYYDYYQPEAYIPRTDTYIEKDAKINEELDRLRHEATQNLITRTDTIICASVSCIYNIGSPENYEKTSLKIKKGMKIKRKDLLFSLSDLQYQRNDIDFKPGTFRVRGELIEIFVVTGKQILEIENDGEKITKIVEKTPLFLEKTEGKKKIELEEKIIFPGHFWLAPKDRLKMAIGNIETELESRLAELKKQDKIVEARRLEQKTNYDLEMLQETGFCHGIENYSRHLEFRKPGEAPFTLIDYFEKFSPKGFLTFIDESHQTIPQVRAMSQQDRARKKTLIEYGFRLPSAIDNRPLTFEEFNKRVKQVVFVSATPADYEKELAGKKNIVEQLIRPTGLLEPKIEIRKAENQVRDLTKEIKKILAENLNRQPEESQRILVLALTKKLAETLSEYLEEEKIKAKWLHSEIKTLERPEILKNFRLGKYQVLVGINLLREGLDLPEVSLVAILDADKEGFLRNETTLIQIMGRAARNTHGRVILYADKITKSIKNAMEEIERRRKIQEDYNKKMGITPKPIIKEIKDWSFGKKEEVEAEFSHFSDKKLLEKEIKEASKNLDFERAAAIRAWIKGQN